MPIFSPKFAKSVLKYHSGSLSRKLPLWSRKTFRAYSSHSNKSPLDKTKIMFTFNEHEFPIILDGGLATQLETKYHCNLDHALWSTKVLQVNPQLIKKVHTDFIEAGCDLIITCTYQTFPKGFKNYNEFKLSIQTACSMARCASLNNSRKVIIAGSVGSYGASMGGGQEYTGEYNLPETNAETFLQQWHIPRIEVLMSEKVDLLAVETVPLGIEGIALSRLLNRIKYPGYISFCCKNAEELSSGEKLRAVLEKLDYSDYLVGIGVNCTAAKYVTNLVKIIRQFLDEDTCKDQKHSKLASRKNPLQIVVYPNSGETYSEEKTWKIDTSVSDKTFLDFAEEWFENGATMIGGCCRIYPETIRELRKKFRETKCNITTSNL